MKRCFSTRAALSLWRRACQAFCLYLVVFLPLASHGATVLQSSDGSYVAFQAEAVGSIVPGGTPTFWSKVDDVTGSGGAALVAAGVNNVDVAPSGFVTYQIKFAQAGTYTVYYRWKGELARTAGDKFTANSTYLPLAFGTFVTPGADQISNFYRSISNDRNAPENEVFGWTAELAHPYTVTEADVTAGTPLIFSVGTREAGFTLDRIVLHQDATLTGVVLDALDDSATDVVTQAAEPYVAFEAETVGSIVPGGTPTFWSKVDDVTGSGGAALVAAGVNNVDVAPSGFVTYQIKFAQAGTYTVYYRWKGELARTAGDKFTANSTYLPLAFGTFVTPGADQISNFYRSISNDRNAPENEVFGWTAELAHPYTVTEADVTAGTPLIFSVGTREAGFTLDRIVLHQDATLLGPALDGLVNTGAAHVPPKIVKAVGSETLNEITLTFDKVMNEPTILAGNFTISDGVTVKAAVLDAEDPRRVLLTTSPQTQGMLFTVTAHQVADVSGTIATSTSASFSAWKVVAGWVKREIYFGITGTTVASLTAAPNFPNKPDRVNWIKGFSHVDDPFADNYGVRLTTFFTPATSGVYELFPNNDDEAELFLSSDASEGTLVSVGVFPLAASQAFDEAQLATTPNLTAQNRYRLVGLLQQGTANVRLRVAARIQGSGVPADSLAPLGSSEIETFVNPDLGGVQFRQQPAPVTANVGARAKFLVEVESEDAPLFFQWFVNSTPIAGANRQSYVTPILVAGDSGKKYHVVVSVAGRDTTSQEALLTVLPEETSGTQPYVGINFVGGGGGVQGASLLPSDIAGAVLQGNFNNITGASADNLPLVDAEGNPSPVTLSATVLTPWYSGTGTFRNEANALLLQGYVMANNQPMTFTLNSVPNGDYAVIVYTIGFNFNATYEEAFALLGAESYPDFHVLGQTGLEFGKAPQLVRMSSTNPDARDQGNYVLFDNVNPAPDGSLTLTVTPESLTPGLNYIPAVNALQLAKRTHSTTRPSLTITLGTQNNVNLVWPATAAGYSLESSPNVGPNPVWSAVAGVASPLTGAGSTTLPTTGSARFFRLRN